jgi:ATP-binding cassette subfamily B protein
MEQGRIAQRGTHAELMAQPGSYRRVASLQLVDGRELQSLGTAKTGEERA